MVEIAFRCLKSRWRHLLKWNDMLVKNVPTIVAAACVLHNICEIPGDAFDDSWADGDGTDDLSQPDRPPHSTIASGSVAIREALVHHFNN